MKNLLLLTLLLPALVKVNSTYPTFIVVGKPDTNYRDSKPVFDLLEEEKKLATIFNKLSTEGKAYFLKLLDNKLHLIVFMINHGYFVRNEYTLKLKIQSLGLEEKYRDFFYNPNDKQVDLPMEIIVQYLRILTLAQVAFTDDSEATFKRFVIDSMIIDTLKNEPTPNEQEEVKG